MSLFCGTNHLFSVVKAERGQRTGKEINPFHGKEEV